jgi:NADH:ubiquinone oxidoreductase subunit E
LPRNTKFYFFVKGGKALMKKPISKIPFAGTPEQEAKLKVIIDEAKDNPSMLIHVLQQAQLIYGYLPFEVQVMIADGMDLPLEKVYGVSTFYSQFALSPKGKYSISVCMGTACYVKGAQQILDKVCEILGIAPGEYTPDGKFSIEACRCIGACGLAPVMTINDDVYGKLTVDQVEGILNKYANA